MSETTYLVTGGAGFIGSALVRSLVGSGTGNVVNIDQCTYAGNLQSAHRARDGLATAALKLPGRSDSNLRDARYLVACQVPCKPAGHDYHRIHSR